MNLFGMDFIPTFFLMSVASRLEGTLYKLLYMDFGGKGVEVGDVRK